MSSGQRLTGTVTLYNPTNTAILLAAADIAARPPGGTKSAGPFLDLLDGAAVTIGAGQNYVLTGGRTFTNADPLGSWYAYVTIEDPSGTYHDSNLDVTFMVAASGTTSSGTGTSSNVIPPDPGTSLNIASITASNSASGNDDLLYPPNPSSGLGGWGGYSIGMNIWDVVGSTYSQTISGTIQSEYGVQELDIGWNFTANSSNGVCTYPNIQIGQQATPFNPTDARFPMAVSGITSLVTSGTSTTTMTTIAANTEYDAAYDLFFSATSAGSPNGAPGAELMVMQNWNLPGFTQRNAGTAVINGVTYWVQMFTAAQFGWPYLAFYDPSGAQTDIQLDLLPFIQYAFAQGYFPAQLLYLNMVEYGVEVAQGQGFTSILNYSVTLNGVGSPQSTGTPP